jgi:hypothetical protein
VRATRADWIAIEREERAFAWSARRVDNRFWVNPWTDPAPNEPLDHLRRWDRGLIRDETRWLGVHTSAQLHPLSCCGTGYLPPLPSDLALYPRPTGPQASLAAARITGAEFGTPEGRRQAFRRASLLYKDRFTGMLTPL